MAMYGYGLIPWIEQRFLTSTGAPLASGKVYTYAAGTSTPQATHTNANGTADHANPIILDAGGRPPSGIFLKPTGYKFVVKNSADVEQYTLDLVENIGQVFSQNFGLFATVGSKSVASGYVVLTTDRLVTVNGGTVTLPTAASYPHMLALKNIGTSVMSVTPNGADQIEALNAAYSVPAASSPSLPTILLVSDGVSSWWVLSSHKVP